MVRATAEKVAIPGFREARIKSGVARSDLIISTRVSYTTLCRAERGESVKLSTAQKIAKAIGKTVEELQ